MVPQQARDVGWMAAEVVDEVASRVEEVHAAVAGRAFRWTGPLGAPVRVAHDAVTRSVYAAFRSAARAAGVLGGAVAALRGSEDDPDLAAGRSGNLGVAILNGVLGDQLDDAPSLAIRMAVRVDRRDVPMTAAAVAAAFPDATGKVAVFVHGLCENEESWFVRAERHHGARRCLSDRLRADHGFTGVHVRYNSGRHVSDNGRDLDTLLTGLSRAWPVPLQQLVLVGHSMGGLVIRSAEHVAAERAAVGRVAVERAALGRVAAGRVAAGRVAAEHVAAEQGPAWTAPLTHVVCLGTPHRGAPLEKVVNVGTWAMGRVGESRPVAAFLNRRSAGIKDLRYGYLREQDWRDGDPDAPWQDRSGDVPFTEGVRYHVVCATLGRDGGPLGHLFGDLLVRLPSASGRVLRGRPLHFHGVDHLADADHFDLFNHPDVHDRVSAVLADVTVR